MTETVNVRKQQRQQQQLCLPRRSEIEKGNGCSSPVVLFDLRYNHLGGPGDPTLDCVMGENGGVLIRSIWLRDRERLPNRRHLEMGCG